MGKLKKISFTGIDDETNFYELKMLQVKYPMIEFGVLMSLHWYENGKRFLSPYILRELAPYNLNLSAHFCGQMAKDALLDDWRIFEAFVGRNKSMFQRVQINIGPYRALPYINRKWKYKDFFDSIIIQKRTGREYDMSTDFQRIKALNEDFKGNSDVDILIDESGGRGIESEFKSYPHSFVGYAGGINSNNIVEKIQKLIDNEEVEDFWIDMESGIRNDSDFFDIREVEKILIKLEKNNLIKS